MESFGHGLSCQSGDDYAALALYMQNEANIIDAALETELLSLTGFLTRPTIIVTNSGNVTMPANDSVTVVWDTVLFNNSTFMSLINTGGAFAETIISVGSPAAAPVTVPYLQGFYRYGFGTFMTATGAVNAYTSRTTIVTAIDDSSGSFPSTGQISDITYDTNTGGEAQNGTGTFPAAGVSATRIRTTCGNENTSSSVNILANSFLWVTYIGSTDLIEVA